MSHEQVTIAMVAGIIYAQTRARGTNAVDAVLAAREIVETVYKTEPDEEGTPREIVDEDPSF